MILDPFGRPIDAATLKRPESRVLAAATIQDRMSGYPSSGLTPFRLARIFRAADDGDMQAQAELFEEMEEKDGHLFSQLQTRKLAVQGLEWKVEPADESKKAREMADACDAMLGGLTDLDDNILDMLDAIAKGYSVMELIWDASAGQAEIVGMEWIHPKKITFLNQMTPRVITEASPVEGEDLRPFKFVYHRYKARSGYDTRAGILRVCAWMYLFKNYDVKDWVGFTEVFGKPMRLGKYDAGASQQDKDTLETAVRLLGSDAAGIISKSTEIEFIQAKLSGTVDVFSSLAEFCDSQMSKAILGQTLTSDAGINGSRALGQVHNEVRGDLTRADAKALGRTVSQQIIRPYIGYNFGWDAPMPKAAPIYEDPEDMEAVGRIYQVLSELIDISQEHISSRFNIPLLQKGETPVLSRTAATDKKVPTLQTREQTKQALKNTPAPAFTAEQMPLEGLAAKVIPEATAAMERQVKYVLKLIHDADSFPEAMDAILAAYPDLDMAAFSDLMARTLSNAELYGHMTAGDDANS
ncbi:DUF935 domain-containing protein [Desulfosarcina sp. OttesenSCG-928-B08]|nr:DUF935 domain-containing protein [Desulfosarcina sp. OttesenSCG-928-B08]